MSARLASIVEEFLHVLSEIKVDEYSFRITRHPLSQTACILWLSVDSQKGATQPLGMFSCFSRRRALEFITRYTSSPELRQKVEQRRFEAKIENLPATFFDQVLRMDTWAKRRAFQHLFNLDSVLDPLPIETKRRIMAKRFHPDVGGDNSTMAAINETYQSLSRKPVRL
jgi:hypothetical protein